MHACLLTQGVQWGFLRELAIKRCTQVSSLVPLHACTWLHTLWLDGCHALARQELQDGEAGVLLALPSLQLVSLLGCRLAPGAGGSSGCSGAGSGLRGGSSSSSSAGGSGQPGAGGSSVSALGACQHTWVGFQPALGSGGTLVQQLRGRGVLVLHHAAH